MITALINAFLLDVTEQLQAGAKGMPCILQESIFAAPDYPGLMLLDSSNLWRRYSGLPGAHTEYSSIRLTTGLVLLLRTLCQKRNS